MKSIYVTKSFLPPFEEYCEQIKSIWQSGQLTNQGSLVLELESKLKSYLQVDDIHYLTNGTLALQLALASLNIHEGDIITTPFSYVATVSSMLWQRCTPVFVDIETDNFTIDAYKIEQAINEKTKAIMPVHVFGYACNIEKIQEIADKYNLKVIYDAAHAFGSKYHGKSLVDYGDVSTLSFHATKLFHTIEGGACILKDKEASERLEFQKRFGHGHDEHFCLGINAKQSEFHAAMGLVNFSYLDKNIAQRKEVCELYDFELKNCIKRPLMQEGLDYNYSYYPVLFKSEYELNKVCEALATENIYPRRYFYPSLNTLPYIQKQNCPISEDISKRIACLPLYQGMSKGDVVRVCRVIKKTLA